MSTTEQKSFFSRLWKDSRSRIGLVILMMALVISVLGGYIRPDGTRNANKQNLVLAKKKPGYSVSILKVRKNQKLESSTLLGGLFFGGTEGEYREIAIQNYRIEGDRLFFLPLDEVEEKNLLVADVLYPMVDSTYQFINDAASFVSIDGTDVRMSSAEINNDVLRNIERRTYYLGTDTFGRDLLSRLMGGVIFSLSVGFISVLISLVIGVTLGAVAGYYRGWIDNVIMWFVNVIWSIPTLLMVIAITLVMGKGFVQVFIAVGLTMWVEVARVVRGQVISTRELDYVEAGKALGYSEYRIISKHILPNIIGPVIVISAANFASAILIEAGLSFLGIGTQIPMPSWGMMIKDHYPFITTDLAYLAVIPGLCIMVMVLSFMLIGNRLRDIYDVRTVD